MGEIDEDLISGEKVVHRTSKHWIAPLTDSMSAVGLLVVALVLAWLQPQQTDGVLGFLGRVIGLIEICLFLGAIGWIIYNIVAWRTAEYGITNRRVRGREGLIRKRSTDSLLSSIADVQSKVSAVGRGLGYGSIRIMTASGDAGEDTFTSVRGVEAFKKEILEQKAGVGSTIGGQPQAATQASVAPVAGVPSSADAIKTLEGLGKLRDEGVITPEEFEAKKVELLARI